MKKGSFFAIVLVAMTGVMTMAAFRAPAQEAISGTISAAAHTASNTVPAPIMPLEKIRSYLKNMNSFQADFKQFTTGEASIATGTFYLERPKKFLWQYETPGAQKLVATGSRLFFHDPETEQITQLPLHSGPATLLSEINPLENPLIKTESLQESGTQWVLHLVPADKSDTTTPPTVELIFEKEPLKLSQIITQDQFGVTTQILFKNIRENIELSKNLFAFTPPQDWQDLGGVDRQ